jgi:hypothetical protein
MKIVERAKRKVKEALDRSAKEEQEQKEKDRIENFKTEAKQKLKEKL